MAVTFHYFPFYILWLVVSPWDIPQNKTFHVDGLELGMLFKFQAHLMVNGHPGIQSMYLYQYVGMCFTPSVSVYVYMPLYR